MTQSIADNGIGLMPSHLSLTLTQSIEHYLL